MMKILNIRLALIGTCCLFAGCSTVYHPTPQKVEFDKNTSISVTAGVSQTIIRDRNSRYIMCAQPMADAAYDESAGGNVSYALVSTSSDQITDQSDENEVEMAGRTPAVLITRELFYRLCEFTGNHRLSDETATKLYLQTLRTVGSVWHQEANNTNVTIGDTFQSNNALKEQADSSNTIQTPDFRPILVGSSQQTANDSINPGSDSNNSANASDDDDESSNSSDGNDDSSSYDDYDSSDNSDDDSDDY